MGVEDKVEDNMGVEDEEEVQEIVVKEIVVKEIMVKGIKEVKEIILIIATKPSVILINLLSNHVFAIGLMAKVLIFVWSLEPAPGRISSSPSPTNETLTSSIIITTTVNSMTCYTETNYQKYIH